MVELKNSEKSKRCFIIGTGSSIKEQDLTLLKDEVVIGISGLYHHKDLQIFKPKYYANPPIFAWHGHICEEEEHIQRLRDMDNTLDNNTIMFFDNSDKKKFDEYELFKNKNVYFTNFINWDEEDIKDLNLDCFPIASISEYAMQIALYLGFDEIFLLGFDHDWFNGLYVYFTSDYLKNFDNDKVKNMAQFLKVDSEFQMIRHARIFHKYKKLYAMKKNIYNANANTNTYVDTFPKVSFEKLFLPNYKDHLNESNKNFILMENIEVSRKYRLSVDFNKLYDQTILLSNQNLLYIIYGNGKIGKTIQKLIPDRILGYVDIADEENHPTSLKNRQFDKIIISVLGREKEITEYLTKDIGIPKDKLFTFAIR
ncbi:hypothetical protein L5F64_00690 [Aliarcobacter butzleri]|uniref:hypothetical protein n=1 Tax=Aliarcobacter butzleri TaxID=28197 RepID=UPI001EDA6F37|nr:hypothetical protein [Aliarcobacter butzleri]MCG3711694.1 hypothetical protein [Aliarcobacter butzleri]MCG3714078.1 hypothetical protein [Aliarcobacter butzleri]